LAAAKAIGARETIISTKYEHQAQMAQELGADHVIRITEQNLREEVRKITNKLGADVVIETIASSENFDDALSIVRSQGRVVLVGGYYKSLEVNIGRLVGLEATIVGSNCYAYSGIRTDFEASIDLIASGKVPVMKLVTHQFSLNEITEAFRIAADKNSGSIKVLVNP
jgi:threonine dehydrogenase-like Zn-dependent dehydrogenase